MPTSPPSPGSQTGVHVIAEVEAAIRAGDLPRAASLADALLARRLEHPLLYSARALAFQQKSQFREALTEFAKARSISPPDTNLMTAIGVCLLNLNQPAEAIKAFDTAIAIDNKNAQAHFRKGWTLEMLGDGDKARKEYELAVTANPDQADALAALAGLDAALGKVREARALAERSLKIDPNQVTAIVALGMAELAEGDFASAEKRFTETIETRPLTTRAVAVVHGLLADALDAQGKIDQAFECYRYENNEMRQLYAANYAGKPGPRQAADIVSTLLASSPTDAFKFAPTDANSGGARSHVFLVGFFRSGTTLLEQVLAMNSGIVTLDEQDILAEAAQSYLTVESGFRKLASLSEAELKSLRDAYWKRVRDAGLTVGGKVFIDKLPLNTLKLPLIAALFPDARIIFAVRDPRDVVLSCFRRHFQINAAMFEFLQLESAAEFYSAVMRTGMLCREKLDLPVHEHRYEDMVADFDKTISKLCDFIGVDWSNDMRDFYTRPLATVRTPSAAQIRRPMNSDSAGAWRRYRNHLGPALPLLRRWVERLGYPAE